MENSNHFDLAAPGCSRVPSSVCNDPGTEKEERKTISEKVIEAFAKYLAEEEKSEATLEKYIRDVRAFASYIDVNGITVSKEAAVGYKQHLLDRGYAIRSINSMIASLNCLFGFMGKPELKVKALKLQQEIFCPEEKELTRSEYERLCSTAKDTHNVRLCLILQTICSTGIRVSELSYITAEAARAGKAVVSMKGKTRTVFLTKELQKKLLRYISERKIAAGCISVTRNGNPINRSDLWREMKSLCGKAKVDPRKVFPHNLRHLFARIFYGIEKDIARLADVLGHSSINTTRIYIISTGAEHLRCMELMHLVI